ncbi:LAGLIDADG family homing endonuclease [Fictibacillus sp. Mic-4]|uniref:LAGLIDADG family homing endonuclease n=1 Tax=Fictibacillus sp. Mic-4 TaxID=3132826 RepID=UPI003CF25154
MKISKEEVVNLYVNQRKSTKEIAKIADVSSRYITNVLREKGVKLNEKRRQNGYSINVDFFKTWSPEMAYVLGFVLTDGAINGNTFSIAQKDIDILQRINSAMQSNFPIKKRKNGKSFIYALSISRKEMVDDLRRLGLTEKKSLTVEFPMVPDRYLNHFIRGVIDGDGWVQDRGYVMNVTSGSLLFAYHLHENFNQYKFNGRLAKNSGAYRVWVSGKDDIIRLGRWLYSDCSDLFLPRKRERFEVNEKDARQSA